MEMNPSHQHKLGEVAFVTPSQLCKGHHHEEWIELGSNYSCLSSGSKICHEIVREVSNTVEQTGNETIWPKQQTNDFQQRPKTLLSHMNTQKTSKNHHTSGQIPDDSVKVGNTNSKRGRPRLYPPTTNLNHPNPLSTHFSLARESHLEKNRVAAEKCRKRRKEYTTGLVAKFSALSSKNKALKEEENVLREQILSLKNEVFRHAGCESWSIDSYIAQSAGNVLGMKIPSINMLQRRNSNQSQFSNVSTDFTGEFFSETQTESLSSEVSLDSSFNLDEYDMFWLIDDYENRKEH